MIAPRIHACLCEAEPFAQLFAVCMLHRLERYDGVGERAAGAISAATQMQASVATTRSLGKVFQVGLAGGTARLKVFENSRFEVAFEATRWGTMKELREVVALAEDGRLALGELEFAPLE